MVLLQHCRCMFAQQRKFVADFIRFKLMFIHKNDKFALLPFEGLRGNVRTLSIARWKARSRLPIRDN